MAGVRPRRLMRPALRTKGDLDGTGGSFASYAELDEDRQQLAADLDIVKADLELALRLLDQSAGHPPCKRYNAVCEAHQYWDLGDGELCPDAEAHDLLVRYGVREEKP